MPKANSTEKQHKKDDGEPSVGLQKLKGSLRSAKRLLRKEDLDAQTRIDTERRVATLEKDIDEARAISKERELAVRYRMVKFFDRKKVCRRLAQISKQITKDSLDAQERRTLEEDQFEQRVNLNYILHYPKLEKYIALFPNGKDEDGGKGTRSKPETEDSSSTSKREEIRSTMKERMSRNEISSEPELHLDSGSKPKSTAKKVHRARDTPTASSSQIQEAIGGVEDDDFFEDD